MLTKIPNVAGLLAENAVIAVSLASASFIQPMILCSLFVIALIRKEPITKLRFIGSVICMAGIIDFKYVKEQNVGRFQIRPTFCCLKVYRKKVSDQRPPPTF